MLYVLGKIDINTTWEIVSHKYDGQDYIGQRRGDTKSAANAHVGEAYCKRKSGYDPIQFPPRPFVRTLKIVSPLEPAPAVPGATPFPPTTRSFPARSKSRHRHHNVAKHFTLVIWIGEKSVCSAWTCRQNLLARKGCILILNVKERTNLPALLASHALRISYTVGSLRNGRCLP